MKKIFLCLAIVALAAFPLYAGVFQAPAAPSVPLEAKIVGIAAAVFSLLQAIKKFVPQISGPLALILNAGLSLVGGIALAPNGHIFSLQFLVSLSLTVLTAAGIHGSWSKLSA